MNVGGSEQLLKEPVTESFREVVEGPVPCCYFPEAWEAIGCVTHVQF
jgi:hypothetical protein